VDAKQPNQVDIHVGERIRVRRKQLHMTQEALALVLGLTFQQVQKYERGLNRITAGRLYDMARVLDTPVAFFFEGLVGHTPPRAFREDADPPPPLPPETADLVEAFARITSSRQRRKLVEMARVLADDSEPGTGGDDIPPSPGSH
jgi:transcriptional regulator with XRE-family HTH domain